MRRIALLSFLIGSSFGCSLDTVGTADEFTEDSATIDSASSGDTLFPGEETTGEDTGAIDSTTVDSGAPDTFVPDTFVPDTFVPDTSVTDTFVPDTFVPDTFVPDTFVPDTFVPDTFVPDTFVPDTFMPDTSVTDTAVMDTPPTGSLTGSSAAGPKSTINLTTEGTLGWAHWGYMMSGDFNHKSGSDLITKGSVTGGTNRYWSYPTTFSWTDGTPTANATTSAGIYVTGNGNTISFDVSADATTTRTLKVYMNYNSGTGTVEASLSDGSATKVSQPIPPTGGGSGFAEPALYTFTFKSATSGAKLNIKITKTNGGGTTNAVTLQAASLE